MAIVASGEMAVTPDLKGFESKLTSSIGGIAKKAALAFGGAFAATKAFDALGGAVAAARESNAVAAQTAAVLKSTGGAANVTAKEVDRLASAISRKTGVDDEQIAKASNLLLTFTNIQNQAGKNNDIFSQATSIAVDMGKALGTDAAGSAIQLGKALNDPIKGISALTRVGVTFSDAQKKQIEQFVAAGRVADAQKVILAELRKEFGGSAEAQATAADKLKVTLGNLQEAVGNQLVPVIDRAASFLADKLPAALDIAGEAFGRIRAVMTPVIEAVGAFVKAFVTGQTEDEGTRIESMALKLRDAFLEVAEAVRKLFEDQVKPLAKFFISNVVPVLVRVGEKLLSLVGFLTRNIDTIKKVAAVIAIVMIPHWIALGVAATVSAAKQAAAWLTTQTNAIRAAVVHSAQVLLQIGHWVALGVAATVNAAKIAAAWLISIGPIALVAAAVAGLVIVVVKNWDTIKNAITTAVGFVINFVKTNWPLLLAILTGPIGLAVLAITKNFDKIKEVAKGVADAIKKAWDAVFGAIKKAWNNTVGGFGFTIPSWVPGLSGKGFKIPEMHSGGVFQAPFGQREGLALLRSGETVLTPGQTNMGGINVSVVLNGNVSEAEAYAAGRAAGRGIEDEMARTELRRAARAR